MRRRKAGQASSPPPRWSGGPTGARVHSSAHLATEVVDRHPRGRSQPQDRRQNPAIGKARGDWMVGPQLPLPRRAGPLDTAPGTCRRRPRRRAPRRLRPEGLQTAAPLGTNSTPTYAPSRWSVSRQAHTHPPPVMLCPGRGPSSALLPATGESRTCGRAFAGWAVHPARGAGDPTVLPMRSVTAAHAGQSRPPSLMARGLLPRLRGRGHGPPLPKRPTGFGRVRTSPTCVTHWAPNTEGPMPEDRLVRGCVSACRTGLTRV